MPLSGGSVVLVAGLTIDLLEAGLKVEDSQNSAKENGGEREVHSISSRIECRSTVSNSVE